MADPRATPSEVQIRTTPRPPVTDPTLGVSVTPSAGASAPHRLVTIGDSLTQGFMSAAVFRTDISWPAITAFEMGLTAEQFTFPTYEWPTGPGGLPFDLERFARAFQARFGDRVDFWEIISAGLWVRRYMDRVEDYWERELGSHRPSGGPPFHNMAVYGWDLLDPLVITDRMVSERIGQPTADAPLNQLVEHHLDRAAWPILTRADDGGGRGDQATVLDAVTRMAADRGIETLVVVLGSNNVLGSVITLDPRWTPEGYADLSPAQRLLVKRGCTVFRPSAFAADWELLVQALRGVKAQHVVIATVPSVTIAPIARGTHRKLRPDSRYFPFYTRPWISDADFDPARDPHITEEEARAIDSAIDAYNDTIIGSVAAARRDGFDWYLFDMGAILDRLATRRYVESPWAQPSWWEPYELPPALQRLEPVPNTRFFKAGPEGRTDGGLFSLDGVHPTTSGFGILAQEVIRILELAGVAFTDRAGRPRPGPVQVDFDRLLLADSLLSSPPAVISGSLSLLGWLDERLDWVRTFLPFAPNAP